MPGKIVQTGRGWVFTSSVPVTSNPVFEDEESAKVALRQINDAYRRGREDKATEIREALSEGI